jgi:hypothetical protein
MTQAMLQCEETISPFARKLSQMNWPSRSSVIYWCPLDIFHLFSPRILNLISKFTYNVKSSDKSLNTKRSFFPVSTTAARSRQDSWASSAKKIRPLEIKLGRKPATPQIIRKSAVKNFFHKFLGQFLQIIVKIGPQLRNLELGRFLGR